MSEHTIGKAESFVQPWVSPVRPELTSTTSLPEPYISPSQTKRLEATGKLADVQAQLAYLRAALTAAQAEVARLTGQRCVSCRWLGSDALSCHNLEAPAVEFDRERIEAGGTFGDPTTFGCPMWEGKEVQE